MSRSRHEHLSRRAFLRLLGAHAALLPLASLSGCAGEQEPAAPSAGQAPAASPPPSQPAAQPPARPAPAVDARAATETAGQELPRLSLDNPQARALAYVHDASEVDPAAQPRYEAGQVCRNCALFQAAGDEEWAGCTLFVGKAVNANGWCSAYAPKT